MNKKRPMNLDLTTLSFPVMAIVSIFHRLSGMVLFLLCPVILYYLSLALASSSSFAHLQVMLTSSYHKLLLWGFSVAFVYHILAGIRHLVMDVGVGEGLIAGRRSAASVIGLGVILAIFLGMWIW